MNDIVFHTHSGITIWSNFLKESFSHCEIYATYDLDFIYCFVWLKQTDCVFGVPLLIAICLIFLVFIVEEVFTKVHKSFQPDTLNRVEMNAVWLLL
jgi:hypothetical protein